MRRMKQSGYFFSSFIVCFLNIMDYRTELAHQVESELMACIGCNDCMLACPLPETNIISIAELNMAITEATITNPNVIDFVTACTQCRQCVPVCPADLSRVDMVLWNKLKVEDQASDRPKMVQIGTTAVASGWTNDSLARHLTQIPLFAGVDASDLRRTVFKSTLRQLNSAETLTTAGTYHERLYIVVAGSVEQIAAVADSPETRILVLGAGSFHGEMAVMANQPELYTMRALEPTTVLEIPKAALYQLMQLSAEFEQTMQSLYSDRAVWTHIRNAPMLQLLDDASLRQLLDAAQLRTLSEGEQLFAEGEPANNVYLVRTGFLKVSQGKRVLIYFREGDAFGALAVLMNAPQTYSVHANMRSEIIEIPRKALQAILTRQPHLRNRLIMQAQTSEQITAPADSGGAANPALNATMLDFSMTALLDQGVIQGRQVLVIDQNICTDCNNCVESCGRRHGHARLDRSGLQMGNLLFPTACRHCEDPTCLLCSVNGIIREPDGQISIVPDNCIGCGACAERCPYDNIQMHAKTPPKRSPWHVDLFNMLLNRQRAVPEPAHDEPLVAVKCDLCAGHNDYACVTACPVGAAFRVDPQDVFALSNNNIIGLDQIGSI